MIGLSIRINEVDPGIYREIPDYVDKERGINFRAYRENTILCRLASRLQTPGMFDYASYFLFIKENPSEIDAFAATFFIRFVQFIRNTFVFVLFHNYNGDNLLASGCAA